MKSALIICFALGLLIACSNNKAAEDTKAKSFEEKSNPASNERTPQALGDGIVGLWKLKL